MKTSMHLKISESPEHRLVYLADYILVKLHTVEEDHPYLLTPNHAGYREIKGRLQKENMTPSDETGDILKVLYEELCQYLETIDPQEAEKSDVISIKAAKGGVTKRPAEYIPSTFDQLENEFNKTEYPKQIVNAVDAAAEAIIMGELEIGRIIDRYKTLVEQALRDTIDDHGGEDSSKVSGLNTDKLLEFLSKTDEVLQAMVGPEDDPDIEAVGDVAIAIIILQVRDEIRHEYGEIGSKQQKPDTEPPKKITKEELETAKGTPIGNFIDAVKTARGRKQKPSTGKGQRWELAQKICLTEADIRRSAFRIVQ